jgi:hypothetical protein
LIFLWAFVILVDNIMILFISQKFLFFGKIVPLYLIIAIKADMKYVAYEIDGKDDK